ncbi:MAG: hypothetical protein ACR2OU_20785 [Thermomicrobiales bacterium]
MAASRSIGSTSDGPTQNWYRIPSLVDPMILFAARHALAVTMIVAVFSIAKQVLGATKE